MKKNEQMKKNMISSPWLAEMNISLRPSFLF